VDGPARRLPRGSWPAATPTAVWTRSMTAWVRSEPPAAPPSRPGGVGGAGKTPA